MAQNVEYIISLRDNFSGKLGKINSSMQKLGSRMKKVGKTLSLTLTAPIVATGVLAIKMAADFEEAMTKIETLVGINTKVVKGFEESIKSIAATTGRSSTELAKALFSVTSAGLRGEQAIQVLNLSAKASAVGLGETQLVAKALTGVLQSYSRQGLTAARATDVLTAIVREGNLAAEDLAPTLGRVTGIASELGVSFEEVGASIATFTRLGISTEEAVVGLRGIFNSLLKPSTEAEKRFNEIGLTTDKLRKMLGKEGLQKTLALLVDKFKGNTEALADMFPNVRALSAVLGTAGAQGETYAQVVDNIINSQGILNEAFKVTSETAAFKMNKAFTSMKNTLKSFGLIALKGLTPFFEILNKIIKRINNMPKPVKKTIVVVAGLVAAFGPLLIVLGFLMTTVIPGLITGFKLLFLTIKANPIGILVTVIGLAITALVVFRKSTNKMMRVQQKLNLITKKVNLTIKDEKEKLGILFEQLKLTNPESEARNKIIKKINDQYPELLGNINLEKAGLGAIETAYKNVVIAIENKVKAQILEAEFSQTIIELREINLKLADKNRKESFKALITQRDFLKTTKDRIKTELKLQSITVTLGKGQAEIFKKREELNKRLFLLERTRLFRGEKEDKEAFELRRLRHLQSIIDIENEIKALDERQEKLQEVSKTQAKLKPAVITPTAEIPVGVTKVVSAAPKVFNISIDNLVETINNNVTNLKEGMNESKKIITEALLVALSDVQVNVR